MDGRVVVAMAIAASGCTAAFRTQTGGAMAPTGVSSGTTNSIYSGDRGGLLTRASLLGLGVIAAAGAVDAHTERTVTDNGTYYTVTDTTTYTANPAAAQAAADMMTASTDPSQNFGGLCAGLEIAGRHLGGDTSGWMFDFGYAAAQQSSKSRWGLRYSAKLKFGQLTMHDRTGRSYDSFDQTVSMKTGDFDYNFFGGVIRAGATYWLPLAHHNVAMVEAFIQTDLNIMATTDNEAHRGFDELSHPSPWSVGARFTAFKYLYVESFIAWSALNAEHESLGLEAGFAF
ncbi:hypothetical protein BH11MYX1_BH11MYX1_39940 [soil metagenome]